MKESNKYKLGEPIRITRKSKISIFRRDDLIRELEVRVKWPLWVKIILPLFIFAICVMCGFILVTCLSIPELSNFSVKELSNAVRLSWSYQDHSAIFDIERQIKNAGDQWGSYYQIGHVAIEGSNYLFLDGAVEPNTIYRYRISTDPHILVRPFLRSKAATSSEVLTLPSELEMMPVERPSETSITLSWRQRGGAESFKIYRGANASDLELIAEVKEDKVHQANDQYIHIDKNSLRPNTRYWYALTASNASGDSERTNPIGILTLPVPPTDLEIQDVRGTPDKIELHWSYSDNVSGFKLEASNSDYKQVGGMLPPDARSFVDTISADRQWYRIKAFNESWDSQPTVVSPRPIIKTIQPWYGMQAGNTQVRINGTGLAEVPRVLVGNVVADTGHVTPTSMTIITPPGEGFQDVSVRTNYGQYTLPNGFAYSWGFVQIPAAKELPEDAGGRAVESVGIIVDGVQYTLGDEQQQAPLIQTTPEIRLRNSREYEFEPLKDNPDFYMNENRKFRETIYIGYIELSNEDYPPGWVAQVFRFPGKEPITPPHTLPDHNPIILLLRRESEVITVELRNEEGYVVETMVAFEIRPDHPLLREYW